MDGVVSAARLTPGRKALPAPRKSVDGPGSGFTSNSFSISLFLPPAAFFGGFLEVCTTVSILRLLTSRLHLLLTGVKVIVSWCFEPSQPQRSYIRAKGGGDLMEGSVNKDGNGN